MTDRSEDAGTSRLQSLKLIDFSPTGTTRIIAKTIAEKLGVPEITEINLTNPLVRSGPLQISSDLVVFGSPVYEEYIPDFIDEGLRKMEFQGQPVLAFAVYGNIGYGLSLMKISA